MSKVAIVLFTVLFVLVVVGVNRTQAVPLQTSGLTGTVKSAADKPLEGVAISARADGQTFTTTVFSDLNGEYYFPPIEDGRYKVWAQAVGFEAEMSDLQLQSGKLVQRNFMLKPIKDFGKQLSGAEWMASLPEDTDQDRRMKAVFRYNCTGCHVANYTLQNRFDRAGWAIIIDYMSKTTVFSHRAGSIEAAPESRSLLRPGDEPSKPSEGVLFPMIQAYKEELAEYLTRVRGPNSPILNYQPIPRPTGEAAQVVITEYDIPSGDIPGYYLTPNGTIWTDGVPSEQEARGVHDVSACPDGFAYFTDSMTTDERTIGKLDPRTGQVWSYKLPNKDNNLAIASHGIICDMRGGVWFTNGAEGSLTKFDPKTEKFIRFPKPDSLAAASGGSMQMDSKGVLWSNPGMGAAKLDPTTGQYVAYKSVTSGGGNYGLGIDSEDNAYFTHLAADIVGKVESRTGKVTEIRISPLEVSAKDREIMRGFDSTVSVPHMGVKGVRRFGVHRKGDSVFIPMYWGSRLAKINIHTNEVTEYLIPVPDSLPYAAAVDKNQMIWTNLFNAERVAKFDPFTEKWTIYQLPSLGYESRYIDVDNTTDPPTVWVPSWRNNKIARLEFRTAGP